MAVQYNMAGNQGQQMVVIRQPLRDIPVQLTCPMCRAEVVTSTTHEAGTLTFCVCAILCCIGCDAGCCLIPFCLNSCKDTVHRCPNCNTMLGKYKKM